MQLEEKRRIFWLMKKDFKETAIFKLGLVMKTQKKIENRL